MQEADITKIARQYMGETALPTVVFAGFVMGAYIFGFVAVVTGLMPLWLGFIALSYLIYMSYTPLHESVHRNISGRHKSYFWLNDLVGYLMATLLGFSFTAHKWAHKVHHQNTNEGHKDPDHVFNGNVVRDGLFGGLLLVFNEYKMFFEEAYPRLDDAKKRIVLLEVFSSIAWRALLAIWFPWEVLWLCVIANIVGVTWLVIIFAWIVHLPFDETARYKDTNTFLTNPVINRVVTWLWLWQNYHSIHHLFPRVPFYQYDQVFDRIEPGMRERAAPIIKLI